MDFNEQLFKGDLNYDYPDGIELHPEREMHGKLLSLVMHNATQSHRVMSRKFPVWNEIDAMLNTFVDLDDEERLTKAEDRRKPVQVYMSSAFAAREAIMAYHSTALLNFPYFRFQGLGPEDALGAVLLEKVIEQQCLRFNAGIPLWIMANDAYTYGFGAIALRWDTKFGYKTSHIPIQNVGFGGILSQAGTTPTREAIITAEGTKLNAIDPYTFLPDPNVPIHDIQEGSFVGWIERTNLNELLDREEESNGDIFNVKFLESEIGLSSRFTPFEDSFGRNDISEVMPDMENFASTGNSINDFARPIDVIHMYAKIIPSRYGLSKSTQREIWYFAIAADKILISASPLGLDHNMYPIVTYVPKFDGRSLTPVSMMELAYPLDQAANWFINSHVTNVRKGINDMWIYDPYALDGDRLSEPAPGKLIPTLQPTWGNGVEGLIKQMPVQDVTQANIGDAALFSSQIERIVGSNNSLQGSMPNRRGERVSATEVEGVNSGQANRLDMAIKLYYLQAGHPLGTMMASHTQQLMSQETWINVTGEWSEFLTLVYADGIQGERIKVTPDIVNVFYDLLPVDNTIRGAEHGQEWVQLMQQGAQIPQVAAQIDFTKMYLHVARLLGAKDIYQFMKTTNMQANVIQEDQFQGVVDARGLAQVGGRNVTT